MLRNKKMKMTARTAMMNTVKNMINITRIEIYTVGTRRNTSWLFKIMLELQLVIPVSIQNFL